MAMSKVGDNERELMIKAWFNFYPGVTLFGFFFCYILVSSYLLLLIERTSMFIDNNGPNSKRLCLSLSDNEDAIGTDFGTEPLTMSDAIWMNCITFLTVGYGDYFPSTLEGRVIAVLTSIIGQLYAALITGLVYNNLNFSNEESMMYNLLMNKKKWDEKRAAASNIIKHMFKLNLEQQREDLKIMRKFKLNQSTKVILDY